MIFHFVCTVRTLLFVMFMQISFNCIMYEYYGITRGTTKPLRCTHWPEFTMMVCRQTLVFVRHMTRFEEKKEEKKKTRQNASYDVHKPRFVDKPPL